MNNLTPFGDITTPRLILRLMSGEAVDACLTGDLLKAGGILAAAIPAELSDHPSSFEFAQRQLAADPQYAAWSVRAMILPEQRKMIGHIRFHSRPGPDYLRAYASDAVEFGYRVFRRHRRRGYAAEAAGAVMGWAQAVFGVSSFIASVSPDNLASLGLIARLGFARIGQQIDERDGIEHIFLRDAARGDAGGAPPL